MILSDCSLKEYKARKIKLPIKKREFIFLKISLIKNIPKQKYRT